MQGLTLAFALDMFKESKNVTPGATDVSLSGIRMKALYVGNGGDLKVQLLRDENPVVFSNVPSGTLLEIAATAIIKTGTTASGLLALY